MISGKFRPRSLSHLLFVYRKTLIAVNRKILNFQNLNLKFKPSIARTEIFCSIVLESLQFNEELKIQFLD